MAPQAATAGNGRKNGRWTLGTAASVAVLALVCVLTIGLGVLRELEARNAELRSAESAADNLSRSLLQHAEDTIQLVDNALVGLVRRLETEGFTPEALGRLQGFLDLRRQTLPRLRGLFVYGADGAWLATSERVDLAGRNNADRAYFAHHRASPDGAAHIGMPVKSRSGGQWIVTVSRRVNHPDGSFAGVVLGTVDVAYFARVFSAFDVGRQGSIALLTEEGQLLARFPHDEAAIGRVFEGFPMLRAARSGTLRFRSTIDGVRRVSAFHRNPPLPLVVMVSRGEDEVLGDWRADAAWRMSLVLVLVLVLAGLGGLIIRELSSRQRLLLAIQAREADFRLLAEASGDMVSRISFDGILTYVSPSALRIVGWAPERLIGSPALAGLEPEDRQAVGEVVEAMRQGRRTEALISYRTRHRLSGMVWLESALSVTHDPETGEVDGVVAISRDVTEHKQAEGHLVRLATLDGLTGLANRRTFDQALEAALKPEAGDEPVSLLLIDVDHFKAFNDTYGHQAGDGCLRQVAAALQGHATRPDDLAARYGGEEFALVLPRTDAAGARLLAERIRAAVADLAMPHAASPTAAHVTVSIGGTTVRPGEGLAPAAVVELADQALYAAKRAGRNRVRASSPVHTLFGPPAGIKAG